MDKTVITCCLIVFAVFTLGATVHAHFAHPGAAAEASNDRTIEPSESQKDHITTALRNLASGKFKL